MSVRHLESEGACEARRGFQRSIQTACGERAASVASAKIPIFAQTDLSWGLGSLQGVSHRHFIPLVSLCSPLRVEVFIEWINLCTFAIWLSFVIERLLGSLVVTQQREAAIVCLTRRVYSLCAQTAPNIQQFVLALHQGDRVNAEKHFLLCKPILEELLDGHQRFVSKNVYLSNSLVKTPPKTQMSTQIIQICFI